MKTIPSEDIGQFYIYDYVYQIDVVCMWWFPTRFLGYLKHATVNLDELPGWVVDFMLENEAEG